MRNYLFLLLCSMLWVSCSSPQPQETKIVDGTSRQLAVKKQWSTPIQQLSLKEYPDNPDWDSRHSDYDAIAYQQIDIKKEKDGSYTFIGLPANEKTDTLFIPSVKIMEWMPMAPNWVLEDEYMTRIAVLNQEWNRHQVRFAANEVQFVGGKEQYKITRVDLARNCLNAYLWELIFYAEDEDGTVHPYYHGWFNFPKELYAQLFNERNPSLDYEEFRAAMENWETPKHEPFDLTKLRTIEKEEIINFSSKNTALYPIVAERKRKQPNIVHPKEVATINDFLTDATRFATFSPPGFYDTQKPAKTELSRFAALEKVLLRQTVAKNSTKDVCTELEFQFRRSTDNSLMHLVIGGLNLENFEQLPLEKTAKGWQMPMGIANHSFYESYEKQQAFPATENPYFAVLLDEKGNWLDSHTIGVDGPLFHFDEQDENKLHFWLLSFERHAFVNHILCDISSVNAEKVVQ